MKRNKYGARKTACPHGHKHDSAKEARWCIDLHNLQAAGQIDGLQLQVKFPFYVEGVPLKLANGHTAGITVDFVWREPSGESGAMVACDVKGYAVRDFPLRWALAKALYPDWAWRIEK